MKTYGAAAVASRTWRDSLTLRDVFGAAENVSAAHASEIVHALLASGRVRFVNADVQRELDAVEQLLGAAECTPGRGAA